MWPVVDIMRDLVKTELLILGGMVWLISALSISDEFQLSIEV
jgi:hypothetical protein